MNHPWLQVLRMQWIDAISCLVRYDDIALPIGYETVKKDVVYSDIETRKQKRKSLDSKNDMFRSLVQQAQGKITKTF